MSIELTERAAEEIRRVIDEHNLAAESVRLRIDIDDSGRGFTLELTSREDPDDRRFMSREIAILCSERRLASIDGAIVDFRANPGRAPSFVVGRPGDVQAPGTAEAHGGRLPTVAEVREELRSVYDPEVGLNIVDLGLVYNVEIVQRSVKVTMTLTTPACPPGELITEDINQRMSGSWPDVESVKVEIVWNPPWSPDAISPEGKEQLGWPV